MTAVRSWLAVAVCLLASIATAAEETRHIVLLHVNDSHGHTLGATVDGKPSGGYARLATAVQKVRDEVGANHVLLIHAGDEFSRGDELTSRTAGAANVALMNHVGFALWVPGNGEFYPGLANLQQRITEAKFPVIASNVRYRIGNKPFAGTTQQFRIADVRLGFLGLCFVRKEHPSAFPLSVEDPAAAARQIVPELRRENDLVIAVNHIGFDQDRQLAENVAGIDVIISGHSHTTLPRGHWAASGDESATLIAQAGEHLRYLGRVDLTFARDVGPWYLTDAKASLIPLDASVPEDAAVKALIARIWPATQPAAQEATDPAPATHAPATLAPAAP